MNSKKKVKMSLFRIITFHTIHTTFAIAAILIGIICCIFNKHTNRFVMNMVFTTYGYLVMLLNYLYIDNVFIISGNYEFLQTYTDNLIITSNHQIYADWWYIVIFTTMFNHCGHLKIILLSWLKYIPIFGMIFWLLEFIFVKTSQRESNIRTITKAVTKMKSDNSWILLFPEGTLNTLQNKEMSRNFAKKNDISEIPNHLLLPRSTGLFHLIDEFTKQHVHLDYIVDLTIGYSPLKESEEPYYKYLITKMFHEGNNHPTRVSIHVRKIRIKEIPGFSVSDQLFHKNVRMKIFDIWLRNEYLYKDELMDTFFKHGVFDLHQLNELQNYHHYRTENYIYVRKPFPHLNQLFCILCIYMSLFITVPIYYKVFSLFVFFYR